MNARPQSRFIDLVVLTTVLVAPLVGAIAGGQDLAAIFRFSPRPDIPRNAPSFSWPAVATIVLALLALATAWTIGAKRRPKPSFASHPAAAAFSPPHPRLPRWGWLAVAWTLAWWTLAWSRFTWFAELQRFTFFPLWLGFIVTVNALTHARTGSRSMCRSPVRWLLLFGASAVFWWAFEWLNRFVRNWHYLGVQDFGALAYAAHASLCFSTVLPAVAAVAAWLDSHPRWRQRCAAGPAWTSFEHRRTATSFVVFGILGLILSGAFPRYFYPAVWIAPLALLLGTSVLLRQPGVAQEIARGNWSRAASWMTAALICGFFWELWNAHSAAKWIYTVPGVERWHVFEMPLLGYAGYLPFGLLCLIAADRVARRPAPQPRSRP